jgi:X-X-X-Leu-X-X-Gly heptad repeat protein
MTIIDHKTETSIATPPHPYSLTPERLITPSLPDNKQERFAVEIYSGLRQITSGLGQLSTGAARIMAAWVVYYGLKVG